MRQRLCFISLLCFARLLHAQASTLDVMREDDHLSVAASQLHFLEGKSLEKLRNGASIIYVFEVTVASGQAGKSVAHLRERFIVSFDLWEEKFAVVQAGPQGRACSHLAPVAAEAWCLSNLQIPLPALAPERTFAIALECWTEESAAPSGDEHNSGLTLSGLIDVFSRRGRDTQARWEAASGPLRLSDIKEKRSAGSLPRSGKSGGTKPLNLIR